MEIVKTIEMGVIAGGAILFPNAWFAFEMFEETQYVGLGPQDRQEEA